MGRLKISLLSIAVVISLIAYLYIDLVTNVDCYDISVRDGYNKVERILENKIKAGRKKIPLGDKGIEDIKLSSYSKMIFDEKKKESFLDLQYIDKITKKPLFSVLIHENCDIEWRDKHSNTLEKHTITVEMLKE